MTEEQIKEQISREFLRVVAHTKGFKVHEPQMDHGVDMIICSVVERTEPGGKTRYLDSQHKLDFQIKSTTTERIFDDADNFRFDLEAKNYNDLIARRDEVLPLHLLLVILSAQPPHCVEVGEDKLSVVGSAFWYLPELDAQPTGNVATIRITVPKANRVGLDFVNERFMQLGVEL